MLLAWPSARMSAATLWLCFSWFSLMPFSIRNAASVSEPPCPHAASGVRGVSCPHPNFRDCFCNLLTGSSWTSETWLMRLVSFLCFHPVASTLRSFRSFLLCLSLSHSLTRSPVLLLLWLLHAPLCNCVMLEHSSVRDEKRGRASVARDGPNCHTYFLAFTHHPNTNIRP